MKELYEIKPIDAHIHMSLNRRMSRHVNVQHMLDILEHSGLEAMNIQNITLWYARNLVRNSLAMLVKALCPQKVYSFGGLLFPPIDAKNKKIDYVHQVKQLMAIGFDGIKIFGKPNERQPFGEPFDSEVFDDLYAYLEAEQIPVMFHMGDPQSFWDPQTIPQFAKDNGWLFYQDHPPFEQLYSEIDRLMAKFPKLNVIFAHFYFLSGDLKRLGEFLDQWENVKTDITPGVEMYDSFTANIEETREFFIKYADRIFFGTDNFGNAVDQDLDVVKASADVIRTLREFLETDSTEASWGVKLNGLSLPYNTIKKIYQDNFYAFAGEKPKPIDLNLAVQYTREVLKQAKDREQECPEVIIEIEQTLAHLLTLNNKALL